MIVLTAHDMRACDMKMIIASTENVAHTKKFNRDRNDAWNDECILYGFGLASECRWQLVNAFKLYTFNYTQFKWIIFTALYDRNLNIIYERSLIWWCFLSSTFSFNINWKKWKKTNFCCCFFFHSGEFPYIYLYQSIKLLFCEGKYFNSILVYFSHKNTN